MIGFPALGYFHIGNTNHAEAQPSKMRGAHGVDRWVPDTIVIHNIRVFELGILLSPGLGLELV